MKKAISLILSLIMIFTFAITSIVFADQSQIASITVKKILNGDNLENYEGDEAFEFILTAKSMPDGATSIPMPNSKEANINDSYEFEITGINKNDLEKSLNLQFDFEGAIVGKYEYDLEEISGTNPSVQYSLAEYLIEIHIVNDEDTDSTTIGSTIIRLKDDEGNPVEYGEKTGEADFTNTFKEYDLEVNKVVAGLSGDKNKDFNFTINIAKDTTGTITRKDGTIESITIEMDKNETFILKHKEKLVIPGLPVGTEYTVIEEDYSSEGYETSYTVNGGTEVKSREYLNGKITDKKDTVAFINTNGFAPPTGIILNTFIYGIITLIGILGLGILYRINRKNRYINN